MAGISLRDAEQARKEITQEQARLIQKLYKDVHKEYHKQLNGMTVNGATSSLRKTQLQHLVDSLKEAYNTLGPQLEDNITSAATQASRAVVAANNSWMQSAGLEVTGAYAYVPQDVVAMIASGKLYSEGWTLSKAIWGDSKQKAQDIDMIVARGVAANKSAYDIAKDLETYVNPTAAKPWDWSKVYPKSKKKIDYNAQRLARTMVSHAYQQSLERVCSKNPFVTGYRWRAAHTARTCGLCKQRSTEDQFGLGAGVFPKGQLPLDHPNGMCTFLTVMSDDLNGISNRLADWAEGKDDPELDTWFKDMGGKITPKPVDKPTEKPKKKKGEKAPPTEEVVGSTKWINSNFKQLRKRVTDVFGKDEWEAMAEYLQGLSEEKLKWLAQGDKYVKRMEQGSGFWRYHDKTLSVDMYGDRNNQSGQGKYSVFFHEYGHLLDYKLFGGSSAGQVSGTKSRGQAIYKALMEDYNRFTLNGRAVNFRDKEDMLKHSTSSGVQDIISGLSKDKLRIRWGHSYSYWTRTSPKDQWKEVTSEAWANMNSAYIRSDESEEYMKKFFPKAYELFLEEVKARVGGDVE